MRKVKAEQPESVVIYRLTIAQLQWVRYNNTDAQTYTQIKNIIITKDGQETNIINIAGRITSLKKTLRAGRGGRQECSIKKGTR